MINTENFFESAVRYWYDGKLLEEQGEYDNAVCLQGFAAECALKKILMNGMNMQQVRKYNHQGDALMDDLEMLLTNDDYLLSVIDPACGLRLSKIQLSPILFSDHPERRYFEDGKYSSEDAGKNVPEIYLHGFGLKRRGGIKRPKVIL